MLRWYIFRVCFLLFLQSNQLTYLYHRFYYLNHNHCRVKFPSCLMNGESLNRPIHFNVASAVILPILLNI